MYKSIITAVLIMQSFAFGQFQQVWSSDNFDSNTLSGWLKFEKDGDGWKYRMYKLDAASFSIMQEGFTTQAQYTYNFTSEEIAAGYQIYSVELDLTGDGYTEFYVLSSYGSASPYRQSFKILDITGGNIVFGKDSPSYSYSYPTFANLQNGEVNLIVVKYNYPALTEYSYEVYSTGVTGTAPEAVPSGFELKQNYPNPFNPATKIGFTLDKAGAAELNIFDIKGERIKTINSNYTAPGNFELSWDGTNSGGSRQPSGVYIYELKTDGGTARRKMILLK